MNLGPQMADISVDNQRANFNTGLYMGTSLKNQSFDMWHVGEGQKIDPGPNFHEPRSSHG